MSNKVDHLNMIESIITRMANNSLQIKCWCIAIVSGVIVLSRSSIILTCILSVVLFCYLDARYLALEKEFRGLYEKVRVREESEIDYSMERDKEPIKKTIWTWSVFPFYATLTLGLIITAVYNLWM